MSRFLFHLHITCVILAGFTAEALAELQGPRGPAALVLMGDRVLIAEYDGQRISSTPPAGGAVTTFADLPGKPTGVAVTTTGVIVSLEGPPGLLVGMNRDGKTVKRLAMGHTPTAPVVMPDGSIWVCERFSNQIALVDPTLTRVLARIPVPREPIAAALTPDGATLVVVDHLPHQVMSAEVVSLQVTLIDTQTRTIRAAILLPHGSSSGKAVCISPDGRYAYLTHIVARFTLPTTQVDRGWMNTNAISIIDLIPGKRLDTFLLDEPTEGAGNPWPVLCNEKWLVAATAGTGELHLIDRPAVHQKIGELAGEAPNTPGYSAVGASGNMAFLNSIRRRIPLGVSGPRALAIIGDRVLAAAYFEDALVSVKTEMTGDLDLRRTDLGPFLEDDARKGERIYHDARKCLQHWQSCSSCHPDARMDSLNWDLLNDGIGNPKNTKSHLYTMFTPPTTSLGVRKNAETSIRAGFVHIQFTPALEPDALAIEVYLKSLKPMPSPRLVNGSLSAPAARGKELFHGKASCIDCHGGPYFTDMKMHKVGTGTGVDVGKAFDTPSLSESWRTAPYLHDGSAATIADVIKVWITNGVTDPLTEEEIADLAAYVESL